MRVIDKPETKNCDIKKSIGFDGTIEIFSAINGWITVTPETKNRSKRLGRYGPFETSKKGYDLRNVSDLSPRWMQLEGLPIR